MADDESSHFIALDFETTGLDPADDRVIEVGALRFDRLGREVSAFESLVATDRPSHPRAQAVHGIDADALRDAPGPEVVFPRLLDFLGDPAGAAVIAHNASFDAAFLGAELARLGLATPGHVIIDTLALARRAFPEFRSHGLDSLSRRLGFDQNGAHRALADCRRVARLWVAIREVDPARLDEVISYGVTRPDLVSSAPLGWDGLVRAAREGLRVRLVYEGGSRGLNPREVSPRRFLNRGGLSFVVSFCHLDRREKEFRLDRVRGYELIETASAG